MDVSKLSPGMQQYMHIKNQHPDCVVLFRMGDFYETFYDDAKTVARELEITLTARGKGESRAPLAGIPYHALDPYLAKLVKKGHKVAIVEQLEDPKLTKKLVKRGVVRIVTPGTLVETSMLESRSNNYIVSLIVHDQHVGIAAIDVSTGECIVTETVLSDLKTELTRLSPSEILVPHSLLVNQELMEVVGNCESYPDIHYTIDRARTTLLHHFKIITLNGFGITNKPLAVRSAGALFEYLQSTQRTDLSHIAAIQLHNRSEHMILDSSTIRNLELLRNILDNSQKGTLLHTLDATLTSMGGRTLKKIILTPLLSIDQIEKRLDAISEFATKTLLRETLRETLKSIQDIERIIGRVVYGNANPRDVIALMESLAYIPTLRDELATTTVSESLPHMQELVRMIREAVCDTPPISLREGNIIKDGYDAELDTLRTISRNGKKWIATLEQQERERTGIRNLKIGYNNVFGYYISVSRNNQHLVPQHYIRKQTLSNEERYITPDLKEQESTILNASDKAKEREYTLFQSVLATIRTHTAPIQSIATSIAIIDVYTALATVAVENNYIRPEFGSCTDIVEGRHPVVEQIEPHFVPNDCNFANAHFHIITGPNMSGKSTLMRQVALIQLMAQIGSFVPASRATIRLCDRIFTRVGAYDDLSHGQSTFMVEMVEAANILHNATGRSLVILDEIGRGTSTYDGIALAWAIAEHLHSVCAYTLFATHYHQLNKLADSHKGIQNYNVAVHDGDDAIVFLHKLVSGGTDKSYGIEVAKLAGIPLQIIDRSKKIMSRLEMEDTIAQRVHHELPTRKSPSPSAQLRLDQLNPFAVRSNTPETDDNHQP